VVVRSLTYRKQRKKETQKEKKKNGTCTNASNSTNNANQLATQVGNIEYRHVSSLTPTVTSSDQVVMTIRAQNKPSKVGQKHTSSDTVGDGRVKQLYILLFTVIVT
jgi:hypothetical protein